MYPAQVLQDQSCADGSVVMAKKVDDLVRMDVKLQCLAGKLRAAECSLIIELCEKRKACGDGELRKGTRGACS